MQYVWLVTFLGTVFTLGATRNSPLVNTGDNIYGDKKEYGTIITAIAVVVSIGLTIFYFVKIKGRKLRVTKPSVTYKK